jgi:hypothetical protein
MNTTFLVAKFEVRDRLGDLVTEARIILFIYCLFKDAVSSSNCTALNDRKVKELVKIRNEAVEA